jgi:hypothetical protein
MFPRPIHPVTKDIQLILFNLPYKNKKALHKTDLTIQDIAITKLLKNLLLHLTVTTH